MSEFEMMSARMAEVKRDLAGAERQLARERRRREYITGLALVLSELLLHAASAAHLHGDLPNDAEIELHAWDAALLEGALWLVHQAKPSWKPEVWETTETRFRARRW
jgi:hypothetical protein